MSEVLPQIVPKGAYAPVDAAQLVPVSTFDVASAREYRLAAKLDAAELALGHPLPMLYCAATNGWLPPDAVGMQLRVPDNDGITTDPTRSVPVPTRGPTGWAVSFRFSPKAVAQIDAWVDDHAETRAA